MSRQKKIEITPKKLQAIQAETVKQALIVMCCTLMDEYDFSSEQICEFAERFQRYNNAIDQKLLSIKKMQEILNEEVDLEMMWI